MRHTLYSFFFSFALVFWMGSAHALPSFSEQTGERCASCHLSLGELTPTGRKFKLLGYTQGNTVRAFSVMGVASVTKIQNTSSSADASVSMPKNGIPIPEAGSLFVAGRYSDHLGGTAKWTANLANTDPLYGSSGVQTGTKVGRDFFLDASELRYAQQTEWQGKPMVWGLTLNNAPGMQDLWVTTPVNTFPYRTSGLLNAWGIGQLGPTTMIDGGLTSQTAGLGAYGMWDDHLYVELTNYRGMSSNTPALQLASPTNTFNADVNPYWRLAWNDVQGDNAWMVGAFGMVTHLARDPLVAGSASGRYADVGLDVSYQHITDSHSWSAAAVWLDEKTAWGARSVSRSHDYASSALRTFKAKLSYDYQRQYGASVFGFDSHGSTDNLYWAYNPDPTVITGACNQNTSQLAFCSANGKPDTTGYGFTLYYKPWQHITVTLQQTYYNRFLGASSFVDNSSGNVRAAGDNNLTYLYMVAAY